MAKFEKAFVTGCDKNTEWMLPWFIENYKKHNKFPIIFCDFGISDKMKPFVKREFSDILDMTLMQKKDNIAWWLKPSAIILSGQLAHKRFWVDTDCEIISNLDDIWKYIVPNKMTIAVDRPWTRQRGGKWYNSGVIGVEAVPGTLASWDLNCKTMQVPHTPGLPPPGDQDVIHSMIYDNPIAEIGLHELPNRYNVLRLQILHNDTPELPKIIHWTGYKGKEHIKELMNERSTSDR